MILFFVSKEYVNVFTSDTKLWEYSFKKEPTPDSAISLAHYYTKDGRFKESEELLKYSRKWKPENYKLIIPVLNNIFYNSELNDFVKITKIEHILPATELSEFYLAIIYSHLNNDRMVQEKLAKVLVEPSDYFYYFSDKNHFAHF